MAENLEGMPELVFPSKTKIVLEKIGLREITPQDLCKDQASLDKLHKTYPDLAGDPNFGIGNDGDCPSYIGQKGWWRELVKRKSA